MKHDLEWLKVFIYGRTVETWAASAQPYTLAQAGQDLSKQDVDYKPLIAPRKQLCVRAAADGVHGLLYVGPPAHKSAGFIPEPAAPPPPLPKAKPAKPAAGEARLLALLRALALLSDAELDDVRIPVKVLVRMLDG